MTNYVPPKTVRQLLLDDSRRRIIAGPVGCVSGDTEFLTPIGWKRIDQYAEGDLVAQWDSALGQSTFVTPEYVVGDCETFIEFRSAHSVSMALSVNHRMPLYDWKGAFVVKQAIQVAENLSKHILPTTFKVADRSGIPLTDDQLRIAVAINADGHIPKHSFPGTVRICVRKERKRARLRQLLFRAGIEWKEHQSLTRPTEVTFKFRFLYTGKKYDGEWWAADDGQLQVIVDEISHWDGLFTTDEIRFYSVNKCDADFIQYAVHAIGGCAHISRETYKQKNWRDTYIVHCAIGTNRARVALRSDTVDTAIIKSDDGKQYCFSVPSTFWIARRENRIFVTGNSGKTVGCGPIEIMRRASMQAPDQSGMRRTRWGIVRNTSRQLQDTTIKTWLDWIPNGLAGTYKIVDKTFIVNYNDIYAEVLFRALDDSADKRNLLSLELTGAFFNEAREIDREIVELMDTRIGRYPKMDNGGPTWFGMWADTNAPNEGEYWHYILENLHPDKYTPDSSWKVFKQPSALSPEAENLANLPPGYYEKAMDNKSDEFINVYFKNQYGRARHGKPVHPLFKRERHVAHHQLAPNPHGILLLSFDFGRTPAVTFTQFDPFGRMLVLDEITTEGMGLDRCITERVKPILRNRFVNFQIQVTGDPSGGWGVQTDEQTCRTILQKNGFHKIQFGTNNNSDFRQESLDEFLQRETVIGPAFLVDPRCKMLIRALEGGYHFQQDRKGNMKEEVDKSHPWSDIAESCEYSACYWGDADGRAKHQKRIDAIKARAANYAGAYTTRAA